MIRIVFYIIILFISGCNIFETRDPEEPNQRGSSFVPATTPDILFNNFSKSFDEKVVENYLSCFADPATLERPFRFIASPGAVDQFPGLINWDLSSERIYFKNIVSQSGEQNMSLVLSDQLSNVLGDSAIYFYNYSLSLPFADQEYKGSLEFTIHLDSRSQWFITTWKDFNQSGYPSWSELKGTYN